MNITLNVLPKDIKDVALVLVLFCVTVVTRIYLIIIAPSVYNFDSYTYMSESIEFGASGSIALGVNMPFIASLGIFNRIFSSSLGVITASRLFMLLMSLLIVLIIYLFGKKMSGSLFGFTAAFIVIFEPLFLSYSIVPHNDIFAVALCLACLYCGTSKNKLAYLFAPFLFYATILTRPEFFVVLIIPLLAFLIICLMKNRSIKNALKTLTLITLYTVPLVWMYVIAQTYTRFGVFEKFSLFFKPEIFGSTLNYVFSFCQSDFVNSMLMFLILFGISYIFFNAIKFIKKRMISAILSYRSFIIFSLFLVCLLHMIIITVYGYNYTIINGQIIVSPHFTERYVILSQILIGFALAYPLMIIINKLRSNNDKII